jgi:hypothetical protein
VANKQHILSSTRSSASAFTGDSHVFKQSRFVSLDRERQYPVLAAFDLAIHFALSAVALVGAVAALGALAFHMIPDLGARASWLVGKLIGLL